MHAGHLFASLAFLQIAIAIVHLAWLPGLQTDALLAGVPDPYRQFLLLATAGVGLLLAGLGALALRFATGQRWRESAAPAFALTGAALWLGRAALELLFPLQIPLFGRPGLSTLILIDSLALVALYLLAWVWSGDLAQPCDIPQSPLLDQHALDFDYQDAYAIPVPPGTDLATALAAFATTPRWVQISDGDVLHEQPGEKVIRYTPELSTTAAVATSSWTIKSSDDANCGSAGKNPSACSRKKKLSGHAQKDWVSSDFAYEYTYQHWIYLKLPTSLVQGKAYTLEIAAAVNADVTTQPFIFDIYNSHSEAVHVNLMGDAPDAPHKATDLYTWMGDGGARDYKSFVGNKVYLYDVANKTPTEVGQVALWKSSGNDVGYFNLTRSVVWAVDFTSAPTPGIYRLVVDGVGCSHAPAVKARGDVHVHCGRGRWRAGHHPWPDALLQTG